MNFCLQRWIRLLQLTKNFTEQLLTESPSPSTVCVTNIKLTWHRISFPGLHTGTNLQAVNYI